MPKLSPPVYKRRALVCVLGLAPQILTETLYALAVAGRPRWVPTEIHVITTSAGAARLRETLLQSSTSPYQQFLNDYLPRRRIKFADSAAWVHVIERDGEPVLDIETPEDSTATADTILRVILPLAANPAYQIHASIAGGRKTMGVFLANAISLLGRSQDHLSHVLVSAAFELHPHFFYPPPEPQTLTMRDGSKASTADARIVLAMLPFVRFAEGLREKLTRLGMTYEQLVTQAEEDLVPKKLLISPGKLAITVGATKVTLSARGMGWYLYLARLRRDEVRQDGLVGAGAVVIRKNPNLNRGFDPTLMKTIFARVGLDPPSLEKIHPEELKPVFADINKKFQRAFGSATANRMKVVGPGDRFKRDGQYGLLNLEPTLIYFA